MNPALNLSGRHPFADESTSKAPEDRHHRELSGAKDRFATIFQALMPSGAPVVLNHVPLGQQTTLPEARAKGSTLASLRTDRPMPIHRPGVMSHITLVNGRTPGGAVNAAATDNPLQGAASRPQRHVVDAAMLGTTGASNPKVPLAGRYTAPITRTPGLVASAPNLAGRKGAATHGGTEGETQTPTAFRPMYSDQIAANRKNGETTLSKEAGILTLDALHQSYPSARTVAKGESHRKQTFARRAPAPPQVSDTGVNSNLALGRNVGTLAKRGSGGQFSVTVLRANLMNSASTSSQQRGDAPLANVVPSSVGVRHAVSRRQSTDSSELWDSLVSKAKPDHNASQMGDAGSVKHYTGIPTHAVVPVVHGSLNASATPATIVGQADVPTVIRLYDSRAKVSLARFVARESASGSQEFRVRVHPDGLGSISVAVTRHDAQVFVQLQADNPLTAQWLQQSSSEIAQCIRAAGVDLNNVQVSMLGGSELFPSGGQQSDHSSKHSYASEPRPRTRRLNSPSSATYAGYSTPRTLNDLDIRAGRISIQI